MNVWVKITKKRANCYYCHQMIEVDEFQVVCQYFMKLAHSDKVWTKVMHFHAKDPYCWIDRAIIEVSSRPRVEHRGKKPMQLPDEVKKERFRILRKRAAIVHRLGKAIRGGGMERVERLLSQLDSCIREIEPLGGVPVGWIKKSEPGISAGISNDGGSNGRLESR